MHLVVDPQDIDFLNSQKWYVHSRGYAANCKGQLFHRLLLNPPKGTVIDHVNGNKLDNRRDNLRVCDQRGNLRNARAKRGSSRYKGVYYHKQVGKWCAHITVDYKTRHLGLFLTEEEAAQAYNIAATQANPEFSKLNILEGVK